jgi:lipoprotein-anchoring transpeptidase ErfK/SrfK
MPKWNNLLAIAGVVFAALSGSVFADPIIVVSVPDQRLALVENGLTVARFPVSTSKFGLGDRQASYATPVGLMEVAAKIGDHLPLGAVLKHRQFTGEILKPNAPGRDPIVTRILHLRGLDSGTAGAFGRGIYIHGTAEEANIGRPASYGCIRMRSRDVIRLFDAISVGTKVAVVNQPMTRIFRQLAAN